jgi:hypothetical protein
MSGLKDRCAEGGVLLEGCPLSEADWIIKTGAIAASRRQAQLLFVKWWLDGFAARFSEAEFAGQTNEVIENIFVDKFAKRRAG